MLRPLLIALTLSLLLAAAPAAAATRNVRVDDDYYVRPGAPPTVTVTRGTTVRWNWRGRRQHNVLVQSGPANLECGLRRSGKCERRARRVGTYKLVCSIHAPDMAMTLKVRRR